MPGPLLVLGPVPRTAKRATFLRHARSIPVGTATRARKKTRNPVVIQTRKYREASHSVNAERAIARALIRWKGHSRA